MGVEGDAGLVAVPGVDVADRLAAAAGAEELPVRTGRGAVSPGRGERQGAVHLDQPGEGRRVAFLADVPVVGPGELAERRTAAGFRHAREAEVDAVGQHRGQERGAVGRGPAAARVGEAPGEASPTVHLQQKVGDPDPREEGVGIGREPLGLERQLRPDRRDAQPVFVERGVGQPAGCGECRDLSHRRFQGFPSRREVGLDALRHQTGAAQPTKSGLTVSGLGRPLPAELNPALPRDR